MISVRKYRSIRVGLSFTFMLFFKSSEEFGNRRCSGMFTFTVDMKQKQAAGRTSVLYSRKLFIALFTEICV